MHALQRFLITTTLLALNGCGGKGGESHTSSGSGDVVASDTSPVNIINLAGNELAAFTSIDLTAKQNPDGKSLVYLVQVHADDMRARRCNATLQVKALAKSRYDEQASAWSGDSFGRFEFSFAYSSFGAQKFAQMAEAQTAIKLACRVLGELE